MKGKTIQYGKTVSYIFLIIIIGLAFQSKASGYGGQFTKEQQEVWAMVEAYWNTWKEKNSENLKSFYHNHYFFWGAVANRPIPYMSTSPPSGEADALKDAIDSYKLVRHKIKVWENFSIIMYHSKVVSEGKTLMLRCTDVWMKEADKWQLISTMRDSCSKLPPCSEIPD